MKLKPSNTANTCFRCFYMIRACFLILVCTNLLIACGGDDKKSNKGFYDVFAYSNNPHPELRCATAIYENSKICTLGQLPLLGTENAKPGNQEIAKRLLVSHQWMGDRFMQLMDQMPADIKLMLRSVSAIVIASDIRPSFYTKQTGAIYLDPANLWLSTPEFETISEAEDFRSDFSSELNFTSLWRYLNPNGTWARSPQAARQLEDLVFPLSRLLYHELAHANGFFPPSMHDSINPAHTPHQAANAFIAVNVSQKLHESSPLNSTTMIALAKVMFQGDSATDAQKVLTPTDVGNAFASDRANDDYAFIEYPDKLFHEDVAMLFEELMVKYHFDIDREIAYTNAGSTPYCNDYVIAWGQKNRIGEPRIKDAARVVSHLLLPEVNLDAFIDTLPLPQDTTVGQDWCEPLEIEAALNAEKPLLEKKAQEAANPLLLDIRNNALPPHLH